MFTALRKNIRFYVLSGSILLSFVIYFWVISSVSLGLARIAILVEDFGLLSIIFLYFTLLAGPFCYTFTGFPFTNHYMHARRALGVSAFYFAFLHTVISFFGQLGGFSGLSFLDSNYLLAVSIGFIALFILFLMTITSVDFAVEKLSYSKWKLLHRFVYLAGILILVHTILLGTHFSTLSEIIPQITFFGLAFLLLLEAPRIDKILAAFGPIPKFGLSFVVIAVFLGVVLFTLINPLFPSSNGAVSFDIHAIHKQLAQQALQASSQSQISLGNNSISTSRIPGFSGDRTKRYTVSMSTDPQNPQPNQDIAIHFTIYDASSGNKVELLKLLYTVPMHLIIVNSQLNYFSHLHPTEDKSGVFTITTQFPNDDMYHLYIEFWPYSGIEQQVGFTLPVGQVPSILTFSKSQPDTTKTKTFGDYAVSVDTHGTLRASAMTLGQQTISFTVKDAKTLKPVTNLKPYLASFGHLTLINEQTFDFIHVHPYNLIPPPPNANGGPTVDFLPIGIYGPFKPGIYRAFAEFNSNGKLFTADSTVKIY